jgi:hypothetical protein
MDFINECAACSGFKGVQHKENCDQPKSLVKRKIILNETRKTILISRRDALHLKVWTWALGSRRKDQPLWKVLKHKSQKSVVSFAKDNQEEIHFRTNKYHEENAK